jgi:hypothetical protein
MSDAAVLPSHRYCYGDVVTSKSMAMIFYRFSNSSFTFWGVIARGGCPRGGGGAPKSVLKKMIFISGKIIPKYSGKY